jgi:hypothetical protein
MAGANAVHDALSAYRQPSRLRLRRQRDLPQDTLLLIKICAGDPDTNATWTTYCGVDEAELRAAASFYLNHILSRAGGDKFRLLGLKPGASAEDVKIHKRWLLKWLHPDRNHSAWESALFRKVNEAARVLEGQKNLDVSQKDDVLVVPSAPSTHNTSNVVRSSKSVTGSSGGSHSGLSKRPSKHAPVLVRMPKWRWLLLRVIRRALMLLVIIGAVVIIIAALSYLVPAEIIDFRSITRVFEI